MIGTLCLRSGGVIETLNDDGARRVPTKGLDIQLTPWCLLFPQNGLSSPETLQQ